jgi:pyridoxal/pyridoxine/pyridoxamine kinase
MRGNKVGSIPRFRKPLTNFNEFPWCLFDELILGFCTDETTNTSRDFYEQFKISVPRLPGAYTGTGDLMTALLLIWTHKYPEDLPKALENTIATMHAVIHRTFNEGTHVSSQKQFLTCFFFLHSSFNQNILASVSAKL